MSYDQAAVKEILERATSEGRTSLTAPEAKRVADAYGIPTPGEGLATSAQEAADACVRVRDTVEPVPEWQQIYEEGYRRYRALYPAIKGVQ